MSSLPSGMIISTWLVIAFCFFIFFCFESEAGVLWRYINTTYHIFSNVLLGLIVEGSFGWTRPISCKHFDAVYSMITTL